MNTRLFLALALVVAFVALFMLKVRRPEAPPEALWTLTAAQLGTVPDEDVEQRIVEAAGPVIAAHPGPWLEAIEALPAGVVVVYTTWTLEGEVNNGGFFQYFWNTEGVLAGETLAALRRLGAREHAALLEQATALAAAEQPTIAPYKERWDETDDTEALHEARPFSRLGELDSAFYDLKENLSALRVRFIRGHPAAFEAGGVHREPEALLHEALRWYTGEAGHVDDEKAHALLYEAAESDAIVALMWMARCYSRGRMLFDEDTTQAQNLARIALDDVRRLADEGSVEAAFLVGSAYAEGLAVPVEAATAAAWYHKAGERGHVLAQHNLGNIYFAGEGVAQSDSAAAHWWRRAAEKGDAIAQYRLGLLYEEGRGVPLNDSLAAVWYRDAAGRGEHRAGEALERMGAP